jgi:uncharacterized repeat protein (TIGR01451 family)
MLNLKILLAAGVMMTSSLAAQAAGVQLTNSVFKEVEKKTAAGKIETKLVPAGVVVPGDRMLFVMGYKNTGTKPAGNVIITNPVPSEVQYVRAQDGGEPVVSVDGGKTFGNIASLIVKNPDGSSRAARASDVTHVRWQISRALTPGETGQVSFRGQLK